MYLYWKCDFGGRGGALQRVWYFWNWGEGRQMCGLFEEDGPLSMIYLSLMFSVLAYNNIWYRIRTRRKPTSSLPKESIHCLIPFGRSNFRIFHFLLFWYHSTVCRFWTTYESSSDKTVWGRSVGKCLQFYRSPSSSAHFPDSRITIYLPSESSLGWFSVAESSRAETNSSSAIDWSRFRWFSWGWVGGWRGEIAVSLCRSGSWRGGILWGCLGQWWWGGERVGGVSWFFCWTLLPFYCTLSYSCGLNFIKKWA